MTVEIEKFDSRCFATARDNDKRVGIMSYSIAGTALIIIDHTEVVPEYYGKGVGSQMLIEIVKMAREKNIKIIPLCPFAASVFKQSDELRDVLQASAMQP